MKKVGLLFLIFLALAVFVYFYEIVGEDQREEAKRLEETLFGLTQEEIAFVEVDRIGSELVRIDKEGEGWRIREPLETSADQFAVDGLARDIADARLERTLEDPGESSQYGLDSPRLELVVGSSKGEKRLRIGSEDFSGTKVYVQFDGDSAVGLTNKSLYTAADKQLLDWRNKSVLEFDQENVQSVELLRDSDTIRLSKRDGEWFLESPFEDDADANEVSSLLSAIKFARVERFETEGSEDLAAYGLEEPSAAFRVREEGQDSWTTLELGTTTEGGYFARNSSVASVFVVKETVADQIAKDTWELRSKKVVDISQDNMQRFTLTTADRRIAIGRQEYDWIMEAPDAQSGQETATYKFWYPVADIQFETIETGGVDEDAVFRSPSRTVEIQLKDGSLRHFDFVEFEGSCYARRREGGKWGTISEDAYQKVQLEPEDLVVE